MADINDRLERLSRRDELTRRVLQQRVMPPEVAGVGPDFLDVVEAVASVVRRHPGMSIMVAPGDGRRGSAVVRVAEHHGDAQVALVATPAPDGSGAPGEAGAAATPAPGSGGLGDRGASAEDRADRLAAHPVGSASAPATGPSRQAQPDGHPGHLGSPHGGPHPVGPRPAAPPPPGPHPVGPPGAPPAGGRPDQPPAWQPPRHWQPGPGEPEYGSEEDGWRWSG